MNKLALLIASFVTMLCPQGLCAQENSRQVLTLDQLFALADQNSKSLRPATTAINESEQAIKVARQAQLPDINASISASFLGNGCLIERDLSSGIKAPIPHWGNNFALEVSQVIYAGGAISGGIKLSKLQAEQARLALAKDRNKVHFLVLGYYLDLFKQQNLLSVYEQHIARTRQVLEDMRARSAEGIMLKNDVTRYELLLAQLELVRTQIANTLAILRQDLTTTLGMPEGTIILPDTTLLTQVMPKDGQDYWQNTALSNSPELQQTDLSVQMNRQQEKITRAERRPQIAFVAANHFDGPITIEVPPIDRNFNYWYVGVGVKYNISSLFKTPKAVRRQQLATRRSLETADNAREQIGLAVHEGYIRYLEAFEQLHTQEKSVELARENYAVIFHRYTNELALVTDMLDASNACLQAEVERSNARINILYHYYKLHYLSGTL